MKGTRAVLCPVCKGSGKYWEQPLTQTTSVPFPRTCHGCDGKGWVLAEWER